MNAQTLNQTQASKKGIVSRALFAIRKYWQLYLMFLPPLIFFLIFKYLPMYGIQIAFKDYNIFLPLSECEWVGFDLFKEAFRMKDFSLALRNTFFLNFLDLIFAFPAPILLALMLNELQQARLKKVAQTILYLPHFFSWVIISGMCFQIFATKGIVNNLLAGLGMERVDFLSNNVSWVILYVAVGIWQNVGWGTIVYLAALTGINPELYEAATVDGAGLFKRIWHVTLPGIKPTVVILLIMKLGDIIEIGFDRPFMMGNVMVSDVSDVLSTFVYRIGIQSGQFGIATAIGLFQSVVGLIFLLIANYISKLLGEEGII